MDGIHSGIGDAIRYALTPMATVLKGRPVLLTLLCVAIALLAWDFSTHGKEGILILFFGAAIVLCTLVVGGLQPVCAKLSMCDTRPSNISAILHARVGLFLRVGRRQTRICPRDDFHLQFRFV
jgi:hypothetical protein